MAAVKRDTATGMDAAMREIQMGPVTVSWRDRDWTVPHLAMWPLRAQVFLQRGEFPACLQSILSEADYEDFMFTLEPPTTLVDAGELIAEVAKASGAPEVGEYAASTDS